MRHEGAVDDDGGQYEEAEERMYERVDAGASDGVQRAEEKHALGSGKAEDSLVSGDDHKRLQRVLHQSERVTPTYICTWHVILNFYIYFLMPLFT